MPIRTICIPVAEVLEGGTKAEFYKTLRQSLDSAVRAANLCASECLKQDDLTQSKSPKIYTYKAISSLFPGQCAVAATVARSVEKAYQQDRWSVVRGLRSARTYRSFPWPILHNASKKLFLLSDEGEFLACRIKLADRWWTLRLAGGSSYRDQLRTLRKAIDSDSYGDSEVSIDRKHKAIIRVSCDVPARDRNEKSGNMNVSSSREHLLVASFDRSTVPFVINADVCKQWQSESKRRYQRLRQDRKSEANRKKIREQLGQISNKMRRRMKTLCHEYSAMIVNKAVRMNVETITLDLTIKSYSSSFPWHELKSMLMYKAESNGIRVVDSTQAIAEPDVLKPHVYFKFAPMANRIKIGCTARDDGGRHGSETDSAEELVILAIDNQPKSKVKAREKHWQSYFAHCCDSGRSRVREWFHAEPILAWLREASWLGNAGNLSQIAQVLDVSSDTVHAGHLQADRECSFRPIANGCSQNAVSGEDIAEQSATALAVTDQLIGN